LYYRESCNDVVDCDVVGSRGAGRSEMKDEEAGVYVDSETDDKRALSFEWRKASKWRCA
jgi:hypothetical protein